MLIVLAAMTFAACENDRPTIMAYGIEHEVIGKRDLTLIIQPTYEYTTPWGATVLSRFLALSALTRSRVNVSASMRDR